MKKLKLAIVCLSGCSNCYKSFLDIDKWLLNLSTQIEIIYNSSTDISEYPEEVDLVLIEGSILTKENLELIKTVRDRSKILISVGDCAVNNHVNTFLNPLGQIRSFLQSCYLQTADNIHHPIVNNSKIASQLLESVQPVQALIDVDAYLPECPPNINHIRAVLEMLLMGEIPHLMGEQIRFS
jgi:NAD-reducing hydrogenase small subunit